MPVDNNIIEQSTRDDKEKRKYMKTPPIRFMKETVHHLEEES
jgi:hypothetical protein